MTDGTLDAYLNPSPSPASQNFGAVDPYTWGYTNEDGVITAKKILNFSFNNGSGGTLTLGGTNNGNGQMIVKDSTGTKVVQVDLDAVRVFGTTSFRTSYLSGTSITDLAYFGANSSSVFLQTEIGVPMYFDMNPAATFQMGAFSNGTLDVNGILEVNNGTSGGLGTIIGGYFTGTAAHSAGGGTSLSGGTILIDGGFVDVHATQGMLITSLGTYACVIDGLAIVSGDLVVLGSKSRAVYSSEGTIALYANESPDAWFMDFCEDKDKVDPLFFEVTEPPYHYVKCDGGGYQIWGIQKGTSGGRFKKVAQVLKK